MNKLLMGISLLLSASSFAAGKPAEGLTFSECLSPGTESAVTVRQFKTLGHGVYEATMTYNYYMPMNDKMTCTDRYENESVHLICRSETQQNRDWIPLAIYKRSQGQILGVVDFGDNKVTPLLCQ